MSDSFVNDRKLIALAANDLMLLGRCLAVDDRLTEWESASDPVAGGIAADGLDQARGLLEELVNGGRAAELLTAVRRLAAKLPPPIE